MEYPAVAAYGFFTRDRSFVRTGRTERFWTQAAKTAAKAVSRGQPVRRLRATVTPPGGGPQGAEQFAGRGSAVDEVAPTRQALQGSELEEYEAGQQMGATRAVRVTKPNRKRSA
jgi:hypothetical protein